ncbi:hypothetical protein [Streptomyces sp. NBC_00388]|uniref:hypothetical protein n=1 Tax=Streptomyces sp. NBC_00388 TaxID=2975735 RepID=UPI002E24A042
MTTRYAGDSRWAADALVAIGVSLLLPVLLPTVDAMAGAAAGGRSLLWAALGVALFAVLWPTRVTGTAGLLVSRGLVQRDHVHTDRLVAVSRPDGVTQRLILRDTDGNRLELGIRVLVANPSLWQILHTGARMSVARGTLTTGRLPLQEVSLRIDRELARSILALSGLR